MKNMEILEEFSSCNDQTTVKGKRSKRLRPSSSASSSGGGGEFNCNSLISSPTSSSGISTITEEDEDMANCLILLAGGGSRKNITCNENEFSGRKFAEIAAATTNGKVGTYVYECKTCNRTFPSFQALGGHRASHKKPKPTIDVDLEISPPPRGSVAAPGDEVEQDITPPISTHLLKSKRLNIENKRKIHECSICGSEFASGQALGGHMRRHRSATNSNTTKSANDSSSQDEIGEKSRNMLALDLDLNLPAPLDEGRRDREFDDQFASDQQAYLVFSAAALVDCHY